ncbi:MAG: HEAT repeat domain-containing protein, partial [Planctomycetales bacterium]
MYCAMTLCLLECVLAAQTDAADLQQSVQALSATVRREGDVRIRVEAARSLGSLGLRARASASEGLSAALRDLAAPELIDALDDFDYRVRSASAAALGNLGTNATEAVPRLVEALGDQDSTVRTAAVRALGGIGEEAL